MSKLTILQCTLFMICLFLSSSLWGQECPGKETAYLTEELDGDYLYVWDQDPGVSGYIVKVLENNVVFFETTVSNNSIWLSKETFNPFENVENKIVSVQIDCPDPDPEVAIVVLNIVMEVEIVYKKCSERELLPNELYRLESEHNPTLSEQEYYGFCICHFSHEVEMASNNQYCVVEVGPDIGVTVANHFHKHGCFENYSKRCENTKVVDPKKIEKFSAEDALNTGIESLQLAPNPSKNSFQVSWENFDDNHLTLQIYSINGNKIVREYNMSELSSDREIRHDLVSGLYIVRLTDTTGQSAFTKLIVGN